MEGVLLTCVHCTNVYMLHAYEFHVGLVCFKERRVHGNNFVTSYLNLICTVL
jgi:hypothetical protein